MPIYQRRDFIMAQLDELSYHQAHPALCTYMAHRAAAFRAAFGMPLTTPPGPIPFKMLCNSAMSSYVAIRTPMSGYLEMSQRGLDFYEQHGSKLDTLYEAFREEHVRFLLALLTEWYELAPQSVSSADLLQQGFDDRIAGPDPLDYI